jgi:hypothetical protein
MVPIDPEAGPGALSDQLYATLASATASGLEGRPIRLLDALAACDPRNRRDVVRAYWQLSCAMLDFEFRADESRRLEELHDTTEASGTPASSELRAASAAAIARRTEAHVRVLEAQQRLAGLLGQPLTGQLLLASDAPHAGAYRTKFDVLFAGRPAPPQAILLNRILPLRHQEVEARAAAVAAVQAAVAAGLESHHAGKLETIQLLSDLAMLASVRRTLVDSLRQYNDEIADYALGVMATPEIQTVAAMLIKPRTAQAIATETPTGAGEGVQRAQFEDQQRQVPAGVTSPGIDDGPTPDDGASLSAEETAQLLADTRVYQGLVGVEPNKQTQRLVTSLFQSPSVGQEPNSPFTLLELLQNTATHPSQLRALIDMYWRVSELAARRLVLEDVAVQLEALIPVARASRGLSAGDEAGLLHAASRAAQADLLATDTALLAEQFRLTMALARDLAQPWVMPSTLPHGGRYLPKTESLGGTVELKNQAARIASLHDALLADSAAVVELDQARSDALATYVQQHSDIRMALAAVAQQTDSTLSLISHVTQYNQSIAAYALRVLPANAPATLVQSALVANASAAEG